MGKAIEVSVAYALPERSFWQTMTVSEGTSALEAVIKSGVLERFPELDPEKLSLSIYAMPAKPAQKLQNGDRVEILRPLLVDPKTVPKKAKPKKKI